MNFINIAIRSSTRIRLVFSSAIDASAFTGTGDISIVAQTPAGSNPIIQERLSIISNSDTMELVLASPIADSGIYEVAVTNIPAVDTSVATGTLFFSQGQEYFQPNQEISIDDIDTYLFNTDLVWTGADYLEDPSGDLATITGKGNVDGALKRRLVSNGLPWNPDYGGKVRQFIDGPSSSIFILRGQILRQMLADDRVSTAAVRVNLPSDNSNEADAFVDISLKGTSNSTDISLEVPNDTSQ